MKNRCSWCGKDALYMKYHDEEWGVPVFDDNKYCSDRKKYHFHLAAMQKALTME